MKAKKLLVCIIVVLVCSFSTVDVSAQKGQSQEWVIFGNTQVCRLCGNGNVPTNKFCTNCSAELVVMSPGIIMYTLMFSDIIEENNLKIEQKNRGWHGANLQKITKEMVSKFHRLCVLTRELCNRKSFDLVDMVSRGLFCIGVDSIGFPITEHYTETLY